MRIPDNMSSYLTFAVISQQLHTLACLKLVLYKKGAPGWGALLLNFRYYVIAYVSILSPELPTPNQITKEQQVSVQRCRQ